MYSDIYLVLFTFVIEREATRAREEGGKGEEEEEEGETIDYLPDIHSVNHQLCQARTQEKTIQVTFQVSSFQSTRPLTLTITGDESASIVAC